MQHQFVVKCGAVKYEVTGKPFGSEYCHCSMCRKTVGAVTVNWIDLKVEQMKWLNIVDECMRFGQGAV